MAEEKDQENSGEHTPSSSSPGHENPKKRKTPLLPSLSNCHSCSRHFSVKSPQTLTHLQTLNSQWRIVLLCSDCLRLVRSAANCSYCFSPIAAENSFLDCRQCCCRVHAGCVPRQRRLFSRSDLDPETFACVDCCPLPRFRGGRTPGLSVSRVSVEELAIEAKRKGTLAATAKEKAAKKVQKAKTAADRARKALDAVTRPENSVPRSEDAAATDEERNPVPTSEDAAAKDEELALQLHLAMNGSRRISRCCRVKGPSKNGGAGVRVELCTEDNGFLDSWVPTAESGSIVRTEPEKEKEIACGKGKNVGTVLKYCRRATKLNGRMVLGKNGGGDKLNRYLMKYIRRSKLKPMMNQKGNRVVPNLQITCSETSALSDAPLTSLPGCQS